MGLPTGRAHSGVAFFLPSLSNKRRQGAANAGTKRKCKTARFYRSKRPIRQGEATRSKATSGKLSRALLGCRRELLSERDVIPGGFSRAFATSKTSSLARCPFPALCTHRRPLMTRRRGSSQQEADGQTERGSPPRLGARTVAVNIRRRRLVIRFPDSSFLTVTAFAGAVGEPKLSRAAAAPSDRCATRAGQA